MGEGYDRVDSKPRKQGTIGITGGSGENIGNS
jgi:hypothetical protein